MSKIFSRVCLAGEDLDWTGGKSILCNVDLFTQISIKHNYSKLITFHTKIISHINNIEGELKIDNLDSYNYGSLFDYVVAALKLFRNSYNIQINNISVDILSTIPIRSGLSSSAALLVSIFQELFTYYGMKYTMREICDLCYKVEHDVLHCQVGKMDFYSCLSNNLIVYKEEKDCLEILDYDLSNVKALLIFCGNQSSTKDVNKIKLNRYLNKESSFMQYLVLGNRLVSEIIALIKGNENIDLIGRSITRYHYLMDKYLGVSSGNINNIVELCVKNGASGAKLTGCGMGGYVFALVKKENFNNLSTVLAQNYIKYTVNKIGEIL